MSRFHFLGSCLCASALLLSAGGASAHAITVDGSAADWFAALPLTTNLGRIARRAGGAGEYVWWDASTDGRNAWPGVSHELTELRVTGDYDRLYVMAKLAAPPVTSGSGTPQLQLAIDTDRFFYSGGTAFADSANFEVAGANAYEFLVETRFASGRAPRVFDGWGNELAVPVQATLSPAGVLELAIPWTALGFEFVPASPLRFSAALMLTNADDVALDPRDGTPGRAADLVTQNGTPGSTANTVTELADGTLDYAFDLWFDPRGEVVAPVVVNEALFEAGVNSQWIEVANPTQAVIPLAAFKIGDEETPGGNEGMAQFPAGTLLLPGAAYVVARNGAVFLAEQGRHADAECEADDAATPDMRPYAAWSVEPRFNVPNGGDHVLVLDGANTVVDVLTFKNATYPGVVAHAGAANLHSLERANPARDTDDCAADFGDQPLPNPGAVIEVSAVGSAAGGPLAWAPPAPNPARGAVRLTLRLDGAGDVRVDVLDAAGRRVAVLHDGLAEAGELMLRWDARDDAGRAAPAGLYFVRALSHGSTRTLRVSVVR